MVITGVRFAIHNSNIRLRIFDATVFNEQSKSFGIKSVPAIILNNGATKLVGNQGEEVFLEKLQALN